MFLAPRIEKTH